MKLTLNILIGHQTNAFVVAHETHLIGARKSGSIGGVYMWGQTATTEGMIAKNCDRVFKKIKANFALKFIKHFVRFDRVSVSAKI